MSRFRVSKTSIGCGGSVAALLTVLQATGWLPPEFQKPEVVSALTGLLVTIGAAFQVCNVTGSTSRRRSDTEGDDK